MANKLGPPCPGCGQLGRLNSGPGIRANSKYRCVNHRSCDVLLYSFEDSVAGEIARKQNTPPPAIASYKKPQIALFGQDNTPSPGRAENDGATGSVAATDGSRVQGRAKEPAA